MNRITGPIGWGQLFYSRLQPIRPISVAALGDDDALRDQLCEIVAQPRGFQIHELCDLRGFCAGVIRQVHDDQSLFRRCYRRIFIADFLPLVGDNGNDKTIRLGLKVCVIVGSAHPCFFQT